MNYREYCNSRDLAWRILINESVHSLPVDIVSLCVNMGIKVKYYSPSDNSDGATYMQAGVPIILVNKSCSRARQRFTIGHELGHILLKHVGKYRLVNREPSPNDNPIEQTANIFSSRILAPACVLWGCNVKTKEEIVSLCDISKQAAHYRIIRMKELYKRNKFLTSSLEQKVYAQFSDYILNHKL